jgi:hypothetical protein
MLRVDNFFSGEITGARSVWNNLRKEQNTN